MSEASGPRVGAQWGSATAIGARTRNEDSYLTAPPIFLVADGMGGHAHGETASRAVVDTFMALGGRDWVSPGEIQDVVRRAAGRVNGLGSGKGAPGSTVAGVAFAEQHGLVCWLVFNVGDSRAYLLRDQALEQVTVDHSRAQELLDAGDEVAARAAAANVITRAFGAGLVDPPTADQWLLSAVQGDRVLLCTDGLHTEVSDALIAATLLAEPDPQRAAQALVDAAMQAGAHDNVTAVVVQATSIGDAGEGPDPLDITASNDDTIPDGRAPQPDLPAERSAP